MPDQAELRPAAEARTPVPRSFELAAALSTMGVSVGVYAALTLLQPQDVRSLPVFLKILLNSTVAAFGMCALMSTFEVCRFFGAMGNLRKAPPIARSLTVLLVSVFFLWLYGIVRMP